MSGEPKNVVVILSLHKKSETDEEAISKQRLQLPAC